MSLEASGQHIMAMRDTPTAKTSINKSILQDLQAFACFAPLHYLCIKCKSMQHLHEHQQEAWRCSFICKNKKENRYAAITLQSCRTPFYN